ncbi:unnamed protein product [Prorocentrum cordatum]|uniref:PARP n=1 Tax=Prorocentrum cordatum TaxID=2364126 RepID=A0ABN9PVY3_9DINO|nr:unnamed protein product [Polarella glacialis]
MSRAETVKASPSDTDGETEKAPPLASGLRRGRMLHGLEVALVVVGQWAGYLVKPFNKKDGSSFTCGLCAHESTDPSPYPQASNEDEFGGYWPWKYRTDHGSMIRQATGYLCLVCKALLRKKAVLLDPHLPGGEKKPLKEYIKWVRQDAGRAQTVRLKVDAYVQSQAGKDPEKRRRMSRQAAGDIQQARQVSSVKVSGRRLSANWHQACPVSKWHEAFPETPLPTDPNCRGEELIDGAWQEVVYVMKDGAKKFLYDIADYDDRKVEDRTVLATVAESDDDADAAEVAAAAEAAAAPIAALRRATQCAEIGAAESAPSEGHQSDSPASDEDAEETDLVAAALSGLWGTARAAKPAPKAATKPQARPPAQTTGRATSGRPAQTAERPAAKGAATPAAAAPSKCAAPSAQAPPQRSAARAPAQTAAPSAQPADGSSASPPLATPQRSGRSQPGKKRGSGGSWAAPLLAQPPDDSDEGGGQPDEPAPLEDGSASKKRGRKALEFSLTAAGRKLKGEADTLFNTFRECYKLLDFSGDVDLSTKEGRAHFKATAFEQAAAAESAIHTAKKAAAKMGKIPDDGAQALQINKAWLARSEEALAAAVRVVKAEWNTETLLKDTEIAAAEDITFGVAYHMRFRSWKADEAIKRCDWLQLMSLLESGAADGAPSADLATTTLERVGAGLISAVAKSDAKKGGGSFAAVVAFAGAARDALQRAPADPARPVWEEELKGQIQVLWAVSRASTAPLTEVEEALEALPQLEGALGVALNTSPGGKVLVGWAESAMKKRSHEEAALQCAQAARELFAQVTGHAAGEQWQNWTEEVSRACKKQKEAVSKAGALQEADRHQLAREGTAFEDVVLGLLLRSPREEELLTAACVERLELERGWSTVEEWAPDGIKGPRETAFGALKKIADIAAYSRLDVPGMKQPVKTANRLCDLLKESPEALLKVSGVTVSAEDNVEGLQSLFSLALGTAARARRALGHSVLARTKGAAEQSLKRVDSAAWQRKELQAFLNISKLLSAEPPEDTWKEADVWLCSVAAVADAKELAEQAGGELNLELWENASDAVRQLGDMAQPERAFQTVIAKTFDASLEDVEAAVGASKELHAQAVPWLEKVAQERAERSVKRFDAEPAVRAAKELLERSPIPETLQEAAEFLKVVGGTVDMPETFGGKGGKMVDAVNKVIGGFSLIKEVYRDPHLESQVDSMTSQLRQRLFLVAWCANQKQKVRDAMKNLISVAEEPDKTKEEFPALEGRLIPEILLNAGKAILAGRAVSGESEAEGASGAADSAPGSGAGGTDQKGCARAAPGAAKRARVGDTASFPKATPHSPAVLAAKRASIGGAPVCKSARKAA